MDPARISKRSLELSGKRFGKCNSSRVAQRCCRCVIEIVTSHEVQASSEVTHTSSPMGFDDSSAMVASLP